MEADRLNSPHTSAVVFEVLGHQLQFAQDPNSKHLGTTVWDASMVFAKFLEKNCRKGRFSPSKLRGKRVIELGAGCGVAGLGMALLGCDVISTDQAEVLPLLMRNVERNTSRILQMNPAPDYFGSIQVAELNWGDADHIKAVGPPFDYIIGTDVVYAEHLLQPLLQTILSLSGPRTTIMLGYELRSTNVHDQMLDLWKMNFEVKSIPKAKMHSEYQHPSIQLYMMSRKPSDFKGNNNELDCHVEDVKPEKTKQISEDDHDGDGDNCVVSETYDCRDDHQTHEEGSKLILDHKGKRIISEWEARRYGAMAARLLKDVKIT
ncbi:S-adenosyl-L-methionine-dependent methyltransferases superfamily protein [Striga hermonthica]|uniref:S-adenosyl-L-methionine-dependent methyltransferases superfamily protein n=1 Tax=Striga hermonthica TaxID=68872 RepID=A0A9N7NIS6_STRHE|nr:S-adenosyl-L-methionine-dependent methyltransferases superfamily protein [Striga hermonthica]